MKILHAIRGLPVAAGTTTFVVEIANEMARHGHEVVVAVYCEPSPHDVGLFDGRVTVLSIAKVIAGGLKFDVVHLHALWSWDLHRVAVWARRCGVRIVWSPHGMLTEWALSQGRMKKLFAWHLFQRRDLVRSACLHVTAPSEVEDVQRIGLRTSTVVIPLGVTPAMPVDEVLALKREAEKSSVRTLLFVSRIQKKKGLVNLIRAWADLKLRSKCTHGWRVRIVGPDSENHTAELRLLCGELSCTEDFSFVGELRGSALQNEYACADLFVLPTMSENFGSVVIESLACATPVITTEGAPWQGLEDHQCGWWIKIGVESLVKTLEMAMSMSIGDRLAMGLRGRQWVESDFSWPKVVDQLLCKYSGLVQW